MTNASNAAVAIHVPSGLLSHKCCTRRDGCHARVKHRVERLGTLLDSPLSSSPLIFRFLLPSCLLPEIPRHIDLVLELHGMDTLPSELLKYVCHCLDQSSLRTFSEVSSSCRAAAIDTLFRHVSLRFSSSQTLVSNIERLTGVLQRLNAFSPKLWCAVACAMNP